MAERLATECADLKQQLDALKQEVDKHKQEVDKYKQEGQRQKQVLLEKEIELEGLRLVEEKIGVLEGDVKRLTAEKGALEGRLQSQHSTQEQKHVHPAASGDAAFLTWQPLDVTQASTPAPAAKEASEALVAARGGEGAADTTDATDGMTAGTVVRGPASAQVAEGVSLGKRPRSDNEGAANEQTGDGVAKRLHSGFDAVPPYAEAAGEDAATVTGLTAAPEEVMKEAADGGRALAGAADVDAAFLPIQPSAVDDVLEEMEEDMPQGSSMHVDLMLPASLYAA